MDLLKCTPPLKLTLVALLLQLLAWQPTGTPLVNASRPKLLLYCPAGKRLILGQHGEPDSCRSCSKGFYISNRQHRKTQCRACWKFNSYSPTQIFVANCTRTRNTQIRCQPGFYVDSDPYWLDCRACTSCKRQGLFEAQPCSAKDTKCCPEQGMIIVDGVCSVSPLPSTVEPHDRNGTETGDLPGMPAQGPPLESDPRQPKVDSSNGGKLSLLLIPLAFVTLASLIAMMYGWDKLFRAIAQWLAQ